MIEILRDGAWQAIGAIATIIGIFVAIWLAQDRSVRGTAVGGWRVIAAILSILLPIYGIFVFAILAVNAFTFEPETLLYWSVALASALGAIWGAVWATYIQKVFLKSSNTRRSRKAKSTQN
jgi:hypothetical protein